MFALSFRVIFVSNFAIFQMIIEVLFRLLPFDHMTARGNQPIDKLRVIFFHFPVPELLIALVLVDHSLLFMNLGTAFTESSTWEKHGSIYGVSGRLASFVIASRWSLHLTTYVRSAPPSCSALDCRMTHSDPDSSGISNLSARRA